MADSGLQAVFLAERPTLLRMLRARMGSADDAEDALQDMWLRLGQLEARPVANPAAYLFRMASNIATDRRISAARRGALETAWTEVQPEAGELPDAERVLLSRDALAHAQAALAAMPERMQAAYRMFRLDGLSQKEIAQRLGISVSGVEKLLQRAYRRFHHLGEKDIADAY